MRPWLFRLDPERAHERTMAALERAGRLPGARALLSTSFGFADPSLETTVAGLRFPNPVGLAAGFDKDCRAADVLPCLGFGFIEVGTVTPRPQPGNPKPRIFRVPEAEALVNSLGFNSAGAAAVAVRLKSLRNRSVPIGVNIGMNKDTAPEKAHLDYGEAFSALRDAADYFTVNVSSPNTGRLRELQDRLKLERILTELRSRNPEGKPVFVKLAPDLTFEQLTELVPLLLQEVQGLVIGNTTLSRDGVPERWTYQPGGLSGAPLRDRATAMIADAHRLTGGRLPIIGVGGVSSALDAYQKLLAGASLVQVYTGLVYRGPGLVREINSGLVRLFKEHHYAKVADVVGCHSSPRGGRVAGGQSTL